MYIAKVTEVSADGVIELNVAVKAYYYYYYFCYLLTNYY